MAGFYPWLNQKMTNFLGDFRTEREPQDDPSPPRGVCRILFVVLLIIGFSWSAVYLFQESPDIRVKQIHRPDGKHWNLPVRRYDRRSNPNSTLREPIVCPCSNISVSWRDFVKLYMLVENSTRWNTTLRIKANLNEQGAIVRVPEIHVPEAADSALLRDSIVKYTDALTTETFCEISGMWPGLDEEVNKEISSHLSLLCRFMGSALLPASNSSGDNLIRNTLLESPILLSREVFNMVVAQRARDFVLRRRLEMDMLNSQSGIFMMVYNSMAYHLTSALQKYEVEEWRSYYQGVLALNSTLDAMLNYLKDWSPSIFVLLYNRSQGPIILHPEFDWMKYCNTCKPLYCEVTEKMSDARRAYWAFALLGGVSTIIVALVKIPAAGIVLGYRSKNSAASESVKDPEYPHASLLPSTSEGLTPAPLSQYDPEAPAVSGPVELVWSSSSTVARTRGILIRPDS